MDDDTGNRTGSAARDEHAARQVAAAVAIGRAVLPQVAADAHGHALASQSLDAAARWAAGEHVEAERLTDYLMDENEQGLITQSQYADDAGDTAAGHVWVVLQTVLAITAWHAARRQGELPAALVSEVDDDTLEDLLFPQAIDAGLSPEALAALHRHLVSLPAAASRGSADIAAMQAALATG